MVNVSCIIPAYNEQTRIDSVLHSVSGHPLIDESIVVDDGSTDDTGGTAARFKKVNVITHPHNRGKSAAVATGIQAATGKYIVLLDADLSGLTPEDVTHLITPVLTGQADISISLRGNTPFLWRAIGLDYISGERVFPKRLIQNYLNEMVALPGFGFEVFLNRILIENRYRVKIVSWPNVKSLYKYKKTGIWAGIKQDTHMMTDIMRTIPPLEVLGQILKISRLKI